MGVVRKRSEARQEKLVTRNGDNLETRNQGGSTHSELRWQCHRVESIG